MKTSLAQRLMTHAESMQSEGWYTAANAMAEAADALTWQPIATAPKDMRPVLVFVRASRVPFQEEPDTIHVAFRKRPYTFVLQDEDHFIVEPTHWMPLPEPPPAA